MATVFKRGGVWKARYKDPNTGEWKSCSTRVATTRPKAEAQRVADQLEARLRAEEDFGGGPVTVLAYYNRWIRTRSALASVDDDKQRMRDHVLPRIGSMKLADVRPRHARDAVRAWKASLAARTVYNVHGIAHRLFEDATIDELIPGNPWRVHRGELPPKEDKDPEWRDEAVFTLDEVERLISDARIPLDRRIFYAILFLSGVRFGEASALKWRLYIDTKEPLAQLKVFYSYNTKAKRTTLNKTKTRRWVPVHPVLKKLLAEWRLTGWQEFFGRAPTSDDLIVPSRLGDNRSRHHMFKKFKADLKMLGLRPRRQHDTRCTFISLCLDRGAREERLRLITHGRRRNVIGGYDKPSWKSLCRQVARLKIHLRDQEPAKLPLAAVAGGEPSFGAIRGAIEAEGPKLLTPQGVGWWRRRESNPGPKIRDGRRYVRILCLL